MTSKNLQTKRPIDSRPASISRLKTLLLILFSTLCADGEVDAQQRYPLHEVLNERNQAREVSSQTLQRQRAQQSGSQVTALETEELSTLPDLPPVRQQPFSRPPRQFGGNQIQFPPRRKLVAANQAASLQTANAVTVDLPVVSPGNAENVTPLNNAIRGDTRKPSDDSTAEPVAVPASPASAKSPAKPSAPQMPTHKPVPAAQPKMGDHFHHQQPCTDECAVQLPYDKNDFSPDAIDPYLPVDPFDAMNVYDGKHLNRNQRPLLELGRPFYDFGQFNPSWTIFGDTNLVAPQFVAFGDWRTAAASNVQNGNELTQIATRLNLDLDLKITATERLHAFVRPFDSGAQFTRVEFDSGNAQSFDEFDFEFDTGFFEGDLGAIVGGATDEVLPFDLPFAVGQIPLIMQNGIWIEDAFLGLAATIPARHNRFLDISNFDTTFFWGFDNITSPVFQGDDNAAKMYGITSFLEAMDGYFEIGYVYLEDRTQLDRGYHNAAFAYTRRYGRRLSNSIRVITNSGQDPSTQGPNADGLVVLLENSLISRKPYSVVPYFNLFAGFGRPQSVARAGGTGGVLRNTGINFESDGITNYPTLDATANEAYGGAIGINMLGDQLSHQLVFEMAMVQTIGNDPLRQAVDDQYAVGTRYQIPISNSVLIRADAMYGFLLNDNDISGMRLEVRKKF